MIKTAILICLSLLQIVCYSQQPVISVQSFEYIWQKKLTPESVGNQVNILLPEDNKRVVENSFANAIRQRWNTEISPLKLTVKSFSSLTFSNTPKFNTKLKEKQPGTWYMFLQLFDDGGTVFYNEDGSLATPLQLKCKVVSFNDSVVFERILTVKMNIEKAPSDQVVLERLKAHPVHFIQSFDSLAAWLFQPENITRKEVWLKPACVYTLRKPASQPITQLLYEYNDSIVHHLTQPQFLFHSSGPAYTDKASHNNAGGNTVSGAITLFTGISIKKARVFEYTANFLFREDDNTAYNCIINYAERESSEREREKMVNSDGSKTYSLKSGAYTLAERRTDSQYLQVITRNADTTATFTISYRRDANARSFYKQMWDGMDSSTIIDLPAEWNNRSEEDDLIVRVKTAGHGFYMKTKEENTVKEFYINDTPALIIYGKTRPSKALLLQPVSVGDLKLCTILASLPYAYFNYSAL
ncbi:hypothetical protein [Flavihumibacter fluvii]|uniref:hypothetical protein n=1 Tax=Flavihumibacter fluvii TaxID=2838157 RepID=UPI001BDE2B82|nr:hypothetical protein [Flavihumibacter fluvii]ULQ50938.1 hypothetical protein KJS93_12670 [Flavihumibacter fluvii]